MSSTTPYEKKLTNFKEETLNILEYNEKTTKDIKWIGRLEKYNNETKEDEQVKYNIKDFFNKIDFDYGSGFGGVEIPLDLVIVGEDWWMERYEYDGAECWGFKCLPTEPVKIIEMPDRIRDRDYL